MSWSKLQINQHKQAAIALNKIIYEVAGYIENNPGTTDVAIRKFIKERYNVYNLKSDKQKSIVAFEENTSQVHYFAEEPNQLKEGNLIMVDIWAKLDEIGAPFADITWMLYYGRTIPKQSADAFKMVIQARDKAIKYLQNNLKNKAVPIGKDIDAVVRIYLEKCGHGDKFLHGTGHSLGSVSPHGRMTKINRRGKQSLPLNVGYTIEPGVYFKNKFGIRSEIDFYIDSPREIRPCRSEAISQGKNYKLIITTICQRQIIKIWKKN